MDWLTKRDEHDILSPQRKFQLAEEAAKKLLDPGKIIDVDAQRTLGFSSILIVGNSQLSLDSLRLRGRDYQSIDSLVYPGKSGVLDFMNIEKTGMASKAERNVVTTRTFGKATDRHDSLYIAKISDVTEAGFSVYYTPVKTNFIHVRIVDNQMINMEYPLMSEVNLPDYHLEKLKDTFIKVQCLNN